MAMKAKQSLERIMVRNDAAVERDLLYQEAMIYGG